MGEFRTQTIIAADVGRCFRLSLSVDAHKGSMSGFDEQIVGGVASGVLGLGDTVTWQARHFGVRFRMTSEITECRAPAHFVDEQRRGPFRRWRHEHTFTALAPELTRMTDVVGFAAPFGPLGRLVDRLVLDRYMRRLIDQRNAWLTETLETGTADLQRRISTSRTHASITAASRVPTMPTTTQARPPPDRAIALMPPVR